MLEITVGVLALQGAFVEHITLLRQAADELVQRYENSSDKEGRAQLPKPGEGRLSHANGSSKVHESATATIAKTHASNAHDADANILAHQDQDQDQDYTGNHIEQHQQQNPTSPPTINNGAPPQQHAAPSQPTNTGTGPNTLTFTLLEIRTPTQLSRCDALILPGGESTSISLIASRTGLLEPLRDFVKVDRKPVWGTCAGLILLAEEANKSKLTGQELIGGLDVRVQRNYFGRQVESFEAELELPFLTDGLPFHSVFIRAPVVERVLPRTVASTETKVRERAGSDGVVLAPAKQATKAQVEILGRLPGRARTIRDRTTTAEDLGEDGDIVAVRQGNVFGTAFHPELTGDGRIHAWWLGEVVKAVRSSRGQVV